MRKLAFATAAVAALALSVPAFTAPASAQEVKVKIGERHHDRGRHEGWRHREVKKVVIHRDRGRHEGWRRHEGRRHEGHKTVIIKKREG
jgi:hypothetical protein